MSIEGFGYKEQFIGTDDSSSYEFDFKIFSPSHLHIYVQDQLGNILQDIAGDDTTFIAGVAFDPIEGGGTINLVNNLPNAFTMTVFLANDYPDQPTEFANKTSFTMEAIEGGLDFLAAWGQRIAYLAQRALRLHDLDDIDSFDMRLPMGLSGSPAGVLVVNDAGDGWAIGPSFDTMTVEINAATLACAAAEVQAVNSAQAAANSDADALAAKLAAQAALAATLAAIAAAPVTNIIQHTGPFAAIAPGANANLLSEVTNSAVYTMVEYVVRIRRGTATYARQEFSIFFRNGAWELALGGDLFADAGADHNVTFTVDSVTGQINAAVANDGGSNAVIDINKINWAA